jgi:hypothetical protein
MTAVSATEPKISRWRRPFSMVGLAGLHLAALGTLIWSENNAASQVIFVFAWGLLNFIFLALIRRPAAAAALSLSLFAVVILLSRFKYGVVMMTANFLDVLLIDPDTARFLIAAYPDLGWKVAIAGAAIVPAIMLLWWADVLRSRPRHALFGGAICLAALTGVSLTVPNDLYIEFEPNNYVSKFARSGVTGVVDLATRGYLDSDTAVAAVLQPAALKPCAPAARPPHIVMLFDEGSFDITRVPGVTAWPGYSDHFRSFDGKSRALLVEGAGGPSWYTEYNVLTGLSVKSYGRFADFVTRIAAGRVTRGLPQALRHCGYETYSLYPAHGWFGGARQFQKSAGIEHFLDARDLGSAMLEPDRFYFDRAASLLTRKRGDKPLFLFVYTAANHFPWSYRYRPELTPQWRETGQELEVDEYLRRQSISIADYADLVARLKRDLPGEPILIVRFGDHQPSFAKQIVDPALDDSVIARRIAESDPRYVTTYYAIEAINFQPVSLSSALDTLDAPYLPIVVLEAAGLPLDPSFAEQKAVMRRCAGLFFRCHGGAEARRFNRLLIDAGLIKGM